MGIGASVTTILLVSANPKETTRLRLDEEAREIDAGLQRAQKREQFVLKSRWAAQPRDMQLAMLEVNPQIVHFSGHGTEDEGLVFENATGHTQFVSGVALANLFELCSDQVECVVLNGCYSKPQAEAIAQYIPYVIGMKQAIGDRAAIEFAVGFYDALGAGKSIEFAYRWGCNAIQMAGIDEHLTPALIQKQQGQEGNYSPSTKTVDSCLEAGKRLGADALNIESSTNLLSAGERRRLQVKLDELQMQFDDLTEEIQFLQQSRKTDDLRPKEALRLQRQIEQATAARQELTEKLSELEKKLST